MIYLYDKAGHRHGYYTVREFAYLYNVTERTVWNWITNGMPMWALERRCRGSQALIPATPARQWVDEMIRAGYIR